MKKKMLSLALALMLCVAMVMPVYADSVSVTVIYNGVSYEITVEQASPVLMVEALFADAAFKAAVAASGHNSLQTSSVMVYDEAGDLIYAPSKGANEAITNGETYYLYLAGEDTVTNITQEVDYRYPVTATYSSGSDSAGTTYSVQITWATMTFTYTSQKTWDAENHVETVNGVWESNNNTVTVSNHSNAEVTVKFGFVSSSSFTNVSGIFTGKQGTVTGTFNGVSVDTTAFAKKTQAEMMNTGITLAAGTTNNGSPVTDVVVATLALSGALTESYGNNQNLIIGYATVMIDSVDPESDS